MQPEANFVVTTYSWKGKVVTHCDTVDEAWNAIGDMSFGGTYDIVSPTGQPTDEFVPF